MLKIRLVLLSFAIFALQLSVSAIRAQVPVAPLPQQILTAKKVFISNAGGMLDLNMVSGDPRRDYNQFYAAMQAWGPVGLSVVITGLFMLLAMITLVVSES